MTATHAPAVTADGTDACCDEAAEARTAANLRMFGLLMLGGGALLQALPAVGPLCPLRRTTGVPCPLCGVTTGLNALARGDLGAAVAANPLAPALVVLVVAAWVALLVGRAALPVRTRTLGRVLAGALPGLWLLQLHRYDQI